MTKLEIIEKMLIEQGLPCIRVNENEICTSIGVNVLNNLEYIYNSEEYEFQPFKSAFETQEKINNDEYPHCVNYGDFVPLHIQRVYEYDKECIYFSLYLDEQTPDELL